GGAGFDLADQAATGCSRYVARRSELSRSGACRLNSVWHRWLDLPASVTHGALPYKSSDATNVEQIVCRLRPADDNEHQRRPFPRGQLLPASGNLSSVDCCSGPESAA